MKLKQGTRVLWINSFSIGIGIVLILLFPGCIFGINVFEQKSLWFITIVPIVLWAIVLFLIGAIWNYIPTSEASKI